MIEVTQTVIGNKGNCYAACIASIFELDINKLPFLPDDEAIEKAHKDRCTYDACQYTINDMRNEYWWNMWSDWFKANNLVSMRLTNLPQYEYKKLKTFHIISGGSPRDKNRKDNDGRGRLHAVVGKDGYIWFDPYPSREGLISIDEFELIVPADPAKPILEGYNSKC